MPTRPHRLRAALCHSLATLLTLTGAARNAPAASVKPPASRPVPRQQQIDYGPFVTATIPSQWPEHGITNKAVAVRLAGGGVLFDTDACRLAAGWEGGFVEFTKDWTSVRDAKSVKLVGAQRFGTKPGPGWANPAAAGADAWVDPRASGFGPLPKNWVHYKGLYLHSDQVVFSYTVGGCDVLESPGLEPVDGLTVFTRTIEVGPADKPLNLLVCQRDGVARAEARGDGWFSYDLPSATTDALTRVGATELPPGASLHADGPAGRVELTIPARPTPCRFQLLIWNGPADAPVADVEAKLARRRAAGVPPGELRSLTKGGPAHWDRTVTTAGTLGDATATTAAGKDGAAAYVVDTIALPDDNPWHAWMRPGGFDFFADPTKAAVCNWSGDVWVVSGLDAGLKELKWRRIATGLFQPLGLRIVKDVIYVLGRDQVTRLHDLNGDGEADFYENFNNDVEVTSSFHEFAFDLQTDAAGNFYFSKAGPVKNGGHGFDTIAAHHGSVMKLSPDGATLERYATGFRAPNGIAVRPDGQITTGDNEGSWVPKCRLNWLAPGGFYGVVPTAHRKDDPTAYDGPLCWMPKDVDNSSGGQAWIPDGDRFGPFAGRLLHLSYGQCSLFLVLKEEVNGIVQGGVAKFPIKFESGVMRARFNPGDGQLYVAGLKGWQTTAGRDGCFQRVRYTGRPVYMPTDLRVAKNGLTIAFTTPLDPADANDPGSYDVERWNYVWSEAYGSPDVSVADPTKHTHDPMDVKSARLLPDGRSVFLEIPDLKPVMQMKTGVNLKAADGTAIRADVYHTIHELGPAVR